jgi:ATP-dependent RNA helicase DDX24/MAK5
MPKHLKHKKGMKSMTTEDKLKQVTDMIGIKPKPKIVDLTRKMGTAETLTESRIHCGTTEKDFYLYYFLQQHPGRTIVFCNSIDCVRRLVNLFTYLCTEPLGLHAQMHQRQRLKNLDRFTKNNEGFLIATDVAARGLDIPNVEHVVHYQVPRTSEVFLFEQPRSKLFGAD